MSVSVAFAATDDGAVGEVDDEMAIDEDVLSLESGDEAVLEANATPSGDNVVTNSTFYQYFDGTGNVLANVTSDELIFEGDFSGVGVNQINIEKPIKFTGNNATFSGVSFIIAADNVTIDGFSIDVDSNISAISVYSATNVAISNNVINYKSLEGNDGFAILVDNASNLKLLNNLIGYVGNSDGNVTNNVIRATKSGYLVISGNTINADIPAGGGNVIELDGCPDLLLSDNFVNYCYNGSVGWGSSDVVYLGFGTDNAIVSGNIIHALGGYYVYGIMVYGANFTIDDNDVEIASNVSYACGINPDAGASGVVSNNHIEVVSPETAYGIYSGMWNAAAPLVVDYINNSIIGESFFACGIEIGGAKENVIGNTMNLNGNFSMGIALYKYAQGTIETTISDNVIEVNGSNVGNPYSIWESIGVETAGIKVTAGNVSVSNNYINSTSGGIFAVGDNIDLINNTIDVKTNEFVGNYAIAGMDVGNLLVDANTISFIGISNGTVSSNALFFSNVEDLNVISNFIHANVTAGGGGAIYIDACPDSLLSGNDISLVCNGVAGWGSTDVVYIGVGSDGIVVCGNSINALGADYIYGIKTFAKDFTIDNNTLRIVSDVNYANGIDCEGGATGIVKNNNIWVIGVDSAYPIYSGMYGGMGNLDVDYIENLIFGMAYYVVAVELGGANENVINNTITAQGNYTIGIGTYSINNIISGNEIRSFANSVGSQSVWDELGLVNTGIKIIKNPDVIISDNYIDAAFADYAVDLGNTNSTVINSFVSAKKSAGSNAIVNAGSSAVISNVTPYLKTILAAVNLYTVYDSGDVYYVVAMDENGDPIVNETLQLYVNDQSFEVKTDFHGVAPFYLELPAGEYKTIVNFNGSDDYGTKYIGGYISVEPRVAELSAASSATVLLTDIKSGSYFKITLKDDRGVALANKTVTITFNGKTKNYTTDDFGVVKYKLSASAIGTKTLTMLFNDANYVGVTADSTIKIVKEATKVSAAKKTFKAKTKTKKYTVTLKDSKGKAIKKVKVTIKVKGKTYKATTGTNGKATFKITKLTKKGTYTAKVKFAGNDYYKSTSKKVKITIK